MEIPETVVRIPVYSFSCRIGNSFKKFLTMRSVIDNRPMTLEGHILAPAGSDVVIKDHANPTRAAAHLKVPRPGIGRFVTFRAADAVRAAEKSSFGMTWEPEIA